MNNNNDDKSLLKLRIWTVYGTNTIDYPGLYVARLFKGDKPTNNFFTHEDLEGVRTWIHYESKLLGEGHLYRFRRARGDDPVILETWL